MVYHIEKLLVTVHESFILLRNNNEYNEYIVHFANGNRTFSQKEILPSASKELNDPTGSSKNYGELWWIL